MASKFLHLYKITMPLGSRRMSGMVQKGESSAVKVEESARSSSSCAWVPHPQSGHYVPESHLGGSHQADVAVLRESLLSKYYASRQAAASPLS